MEKVGNLKVDTSEKKNEQLYETINKFKKVLKKGTAKRKFCIAFENLILENNKSAVFKPSFEIFSLTIVTKLNLIDFKDKKLNEKLHEALAQVREYFYIVGEYEKNYAKKLRLIDSYELYSNATTTLDFLVNFVKDPTIDGFTEQLVKFLPILERERKKLASICEIFTKETKPIFTELKTVHKTMIELEKLDPKHKKQNKADAQVAPKLDILERKLKTIIDKLLSKTMEKDFYENACAQISKLKKIQNDFLINIKMVLVN